MRNSSRSAALTLATCLLAACSAGVGSTAFDPAAPQGHRPGWVDRLGEQVQSVPPEQAAGGARLATPTQWPPGEAGGGRGVPRDLTRRVLPSPESTAPDALLPPGAAEPGPVSTAAPAEGSAADSAPATRAAKRSAIEAAVAAHEALDDAARQAALPVAGTPSPTVPEAEPVAAGVSVHVHTVEPPEAAERAPRPPSALENLYSGAPSTRAALPLQQFGYDFFAREIAASGAGMVMPDYVVLPGDELRVVMTGTFKDEVRRIVEPDGTISVPDGGTVIVAGRRFAELGDIVRRAIEQSSKRRNFEVQVSMGQVRGFRVHVVGEVERPGMVEVPGRATVLTALAAAGGPKRSGSLRRIQVRRDSVIVAEFDLYDFLLSGETAGLEPLQTEDVLVVPPIGATIAVAGAVLRPGIYELLGDVTVGEALRLAGGTTPFSFTPNARLERTVAGRGRERIDVALDEAGRQTTMGDGELLVVGTVADESAAVQIEGEVVRGGPYPFREGMTVADLLRLADGLTVDAYLPQAFLSRQVGEVGQVTLVPARESLGTTRRVLVIDLAAALAGDPVHDLELRPLDHLAIRSRREATTTPTVEVIGAVREPGTYELTAGLTVAQLVALAGNVTPEVYYDEAELLRRAYDPDSRSLTVLRYRIDLGRALREGGEHDPVLANQDQLVIRSLQAAHVRVRIAGQVRFPGEYVFAKGAHITELIAAAGGVLDDADLRAAVFQRESVRRLQESRFEQLRRTTLAAFERSFEQTVASGFPNESLSARIALDQTRARLERMAGYQSDGRVVIPFTREDFPSSAFDLTLETGDLLTIPPRQETVAVLGHVFNPGAFVAEPGLTVADLVARTGGLCDDGDEERVYVIRADGTVQSVEQRHYALAMKASLYPGDVVLVPRRPLSRTLGNQLTDFLFATRRAAEIGLLLGNMDNLEQLQFTSLLQEPRFDSNIEALQRGLIQSATQSSR